MAKTDKMNVLILGSGGREHALGWKLQQSPRCGQIHFAPGNGGTPAIGPTADLDISAINTKNVDAIRFYCRDHGIELVVIGPEDPLAHGLADELLHPKTDIRQQKPLAVFGPTADATRLEADKAYAKQVMKAASIPTADAKTFTDYDAAVAYVENRETPVVVKATGLAKGKGAIVCDGVQDALAALKLCMVDRAFGDAGTTVLVEERMVGQEVSVLALVDGRNIFVLDPAQDHKQAHAGDTGPNTGGMGAYCPTPLIDDALMATIEREVLVPAVDALRRDGITYQGVLYAGLMLTAGGPKVVEFNCRFGDPECQPLMMRLKGDLLEIMLATADPRRFGGLDEVGLSWDERHCVCVVMASAGYPGDYDKGKPITGIAEAEKQGDGDVKVFHAGTVKKGGELITAGGRVLNVCAMGSSLEDAQQKANAACDRIAFAGGWYRPDIGYRVM